MCVKPLKLEPVSLSLNSMSMRVKYWPLWPSIDHCDQWSTFFYCIEIGQRLGCNERNVTYSNEQMALLISRFRQIPSMDTALKLPTVCCMYYRFETAITDISEQVCSKSDVDYYLTFVNNFSSDVLDLLCAQTKRDSNYCKTVKLPNEPLEGENSDSLVPPLLVVLDTI